MKWIVFLASSLFAVNAFAVATKDCPSRLTVSYEKIKLTVSLKDLQKEIGWTDSAEEQMRAIEKAYNLVERSDEVTRQFDLDEVKSGRCVYRGEGDDSIEKAELYTTRKQHFLMLQTKVGKDTRGILARVYAKVDSISKEEIELQGGKAGLALAIPRYPYTSYYAGGDLKFIGKVKDLDATVE